MVPQTGQTHTLGLVMGGSSLAAAACPSRFTPSAKLSIRPPIISPWLSGRIGLAPIVGAFAAGLILEDVHYTGFIERGEHGLEALIHPISSFLVPVFFVVMGMRTDLRSFTQSGVLGLAAALTLVAILGKQACSLGVLGKGVDRLSVGLGMIPRGEVGLIFVNIGLTLSVRGEPVISHATFSAVVVMVIVTTMVTPPVLKWSLGRRPLPAAPGNKHNDPMPHGAVRTNEP